MFAFPGEQIRAESLSQKNFFNQFDEQFLDKYDKDIFYINEVWKNFVLLNKINKEDKEILDNIILGNDGIMWTRNLDNNMDYLLNKLNCSYIFVGHNTVDFIKLKNNIWFTDSGISRSYGKENYQYIVIDCDHNINIRSL